MRTKKKRFIEVHRGEVMAGKGAVVLKSDVHSACLVIAAYDAIKKVGCLAHARFLSDKFEEKIGQDLIHESAKTLDYAIDEMVKDMTLLGSAKDDIEIRLVTGENVPHSKNDPGFLSSITSIVDVLRTKHFKTCENSVQDVGPLHVSLDVTSGQVIFN